MSPSFASEHTLSFSDETQAPQDEPRLHGVGVALREKIRDGGMSTVIRGQQLSLRRDVAVKTSQNAAECNRLLSEAYVIGALEHPNIVPIHDLLIDGDGRPQLVLKHVEGRSWFDLIESGESIGDFGEDPVERAVRIVIAVSRALSFAHERGIVHRDIKPANIMLGRFGEVYLVDWGLGAAYAYDPRTAELPRLPEKEIAGTPAYMAPEQHEGLSSRIGPWTDVYLLAGTLVHALTGHPPWTRNAQGERELAALPPTTSHAFLELIAKAMAPDIKDRFRSAAEFRYALEAYQRQRGSRALASQARQTAEAAARASQIGDEELAERAATEAEVLFRASLNEWPANPGAMRDQNAFRRWRVEHVLARGESAVAARIVAAWTDAPEDVRAQVAAIAQEARRDSIRVSRMKADYDRSFGVNMRIQMILLMGPTWVLSWAIFAYTESVLLPLVTSLAIFATCLGVVLLQRKTLLANRINATTVGTISVGLAATCLVLAMAQLQDGTLVGAAPRIMLVYAMSAAFMGFAVEPAAWPIGVLWAALMFGALLIPTYGVWMIVVGALLSTLAGLVVNFRLARRVKRRDVAAPRTT